MSDGIVVEVRSEEEQLFELVVHGELTNRDEARTSGSHGHSIHESSCTFELCHAIQTVERVLVTAKHDSNNDYIIFFMKRVV